MYLLVLCLYFLHGCQADENGRIYPRVFHGQEIRPYKHQYLVQLRTYYKHENDNTVYYSLCSGSILNHRWIISAAHCFPANTIYVEVEKLHKQILAEVDKTQIILHPGYSDKTPLTYTMLEHDLALLKTQKSIKVNLFTGPIPISTRRPKIGDAVIIAGYGDAEYGLRVPREGSTIVTMCDVFRKNLICTQSLIRAGKGDSGGALVSKGRLVGVISAGCEDVEIHKDCETIYVDVAMHLNWIKEVMVNRTGT